MYVCPECGERFDLHMGVKARSQFEARGVTLTVVHDHERGVWSAVVLEKGERKSADAKDIVSKNLEMKKVARLKAVEEKRAEKAAANPLPWAIDPERTYLGDLKQKQG